jgi:hypothetical protein
VRIQVQSIAQLLIPPQLPPHLLPQPLPQLLPPFDPSPPHTSASRHHHRSLRTPLSAAPPPSCSAWRDGALVNLRASLWE